MTRNELKNVLPRTAISQPQERERVNTGDEEAANEPFGQTLPEIRAIPRQAAFDGASPDTGEKLLRLRKVLLRSLWQMAAGLCLIMAALVYLAP